ncbi:MAG TPA: cytochrome d ubiquinol oxidase subunit II [Bacteroidales bacterium]|nr:cytochrome d ubiquinol oxidase subunit II [Bacteroidales bacterium]HNY76011.1 cytochrome d ubiquinol oxidase subunit II [Bacteroidales bacterium]HPB19943.1 cytochrome d ubiquinol oxidase subunit II [Bacteroidales bacterium]
MFEQLSYNALQGYWWLIISVLGASLVFMMFVQGGQSLIYSLGKKEPQLSLMLNAIGTRWDLSFTTLVVFGGAMFAAFPLFYSTSFGGAYWLWMLILFTFILQAVSYEFRNKARNFLGAKTYEWFLFLNGLIGTISLGVAVGTFFTGGNFVHNDMNFVSWTTNWHGLEAFANIKNLLLGFSIFFLARILAILFLMNRVDDEQLYVKSKKQLLINAAVFLVFFLSFVFAILLGNGYAVDPTTQLVYIEKYKYFNNFIELPWLGILFLIGVVLVLLGIATPYLKNKKLGTKGIWFAGFGTFFTVLALFLCLGFNNTVFYPSLVDMQSSLTIHNASSSRYTLIVMSYVSLLVPFVVAYIVYSWRQLLKKKFTADEISESDTAY